MWIFLKKSRKRFCAYKIKRYFCTRKTEAKETGNGIRYAKQTFGV